MSLSLPYTSRADRSPSPWQSRSFPSSRPRSLSPPPVTPWENRLYQIVGQQETSVADSGWLEKMCKEEIVASSLTIITPPPPLGEVREDRIIFFQKDIILYT